MLPGQINNLFNLAGCDVTGLDAADTTSSSMHFEHDTHGFFMVHAKDGFEYLDDKRHRREIIVQQQYLVERWWVDINRLSFEERGAFLGFSMGCHGHNLRSERQIFNGFVIKSPLNPPDRLCAAAKIIVKTC